MQSIERARELYYLRAFSSRALVALPDTPLVWKACVIGGVTRSGLIAPAGQILRFRIKPLPGEFFRALVSAPAGARTASFQAAIKSLSGETLSEKTISLSPAASPRLKWIPLQLPLSALEGQEIDLELSASWTGSTTQECIWADPALLAPKSFGHLGLRAISLLLDGGFKSVKERWALGMAKADSYEEWAKRKAASAAALDSMAAECRAWPSRPKLSLLMPVAEPEPAPLRACVESLLSQAYPDWELLLCPAANARPETRGLLEDIAKSDPRILLRPAAAAPGEFVAWIDCRDELPPEALFEAASALREDPGIDVVYGDEDEKDRLGRRRSPCFKPDWSPEYLRSRRYIGRLCFYRRALVVETGGFPENPAGEADRDLALRLLERAPRARHIPKILYHRGTQRPEIPPPARHPIKGRPLVSILIPTAGRAVQTDKGPEYMIERCARIVSEKTEYDNYEMLVFDNGDLNESVRRALQGLGCELVTYRYKPPFNYAAKMNFASRHARGEHIVMLGDDVTPVNGDWLGAMLEYSQQPGVGGVGARLYFPNGTLQHVGIALAPLPLHPLKGFPKDYNGYYLDNNAARECAAVTGACFMSRKSVLDEVGGMDERLAISYNDVDLCLRIRQKGYRMIYTPYAELVHDESASLGARAMDADGELFLKRWGGSKDPYYNPNLAPGDASCGLNWDF